MFQKLWQKIQLRYIKWQKKYLAETSPEEVLNSLKRWTFSQAHYARGLNFYAYLYQEMGRFAEAEPFYLQAIEIKKVQLGENHSDYANILNNLAALYHKMGRFADAEPFYLQAKEIRKTQLGENHSDYANILNNLAALYHKMGRFAEAEPFYLQTMAIRKTQLGENHLDYATSLNNLATLYREIGQFAEAERLYLQAIAIKKLQLGENHPDYASSLSGLGILYQAMGRFAEAEHLLLQAREIYRMRLGENHLDYATSLNNLAVLYQETGRFKEAEPLYLQAKEIRKAQLGENHPDYANSLNNLAYLYQEIGRFTDAEPLHLQAIEIKKEHLGENHPQYALSLNNLAELCQSMGQFKEAEHLLLQAKEILQARLGENHPQYALSLNNLAELCQSMGQFKEAEHLLLQAKEILQARLGENHPNYATILNNLAGLYRAMGRFADAETLDLQAKEIYRVQLGENNFRYASSLNNLAGLYQAMGRFAEAGRLLLQAMAIRKEQFGENHPHYAQSLNNLALLYEKIGRFTEAEHLLLQAREIRQVQLGENHSDYANILNNWAGLYRVMGRFTEAEPFCWQAIEIWKKQLGENHPQYALSLNNLAALYYAMGRFNEAESLLLQAVAIKKAQLGENHPDYALSLNNLAALCQAMKRLTDAEPLYLQAMEIWKKQLGENHPDYALSLNNLAILMAAMNRPQEALPLMQEAAKIQNRIIGEILSISSDRQRLEYLRQNYWQLEIFLSLVNQYFPHDPAAKQAALDLVLRRKGLATEAGILLRTLIMSDRYRHLAPQLDQLRQLCHQIAYVTWQVPKSPEGLAEYLQRLADLNRKQDELEQFLSRQIPEMNLQQQLDNANRQAIAATLPPGSTLVELVQFRICNFSGVEANGDTQWLPARYLAFILPGGESERVEMVDLGDAGEIDELCRQFRLLASGEASENPGEKRVVACFDDDETAENQPSYEETWTYPEVGKQLYAKVIQPLKKYLLPQQVVYLSPDGELATVPFGILSADGTVELMQEYQLRYLNVGRDILRLNVAIPVEYSPPLVIANPDYNLRLEDAEETSAKSADLSQLESSVDFGSLARELGRGNGEVFKPLPGTKIEGERIAQLLGVPVYTEAQAVKSLLSKSRSPKIVHIATHGYFLPVNQNSSDNKFVFDFSSWGMSSRFNFANLVNPLTRSGLAFAGANTAFKEGKIAANAEDGLLTAQGAIGLDFTGTALVVLSACDTALGNKSIGESAIGLRRSFIVAGAETLVMSLWKVPDVPTAILMERLYHNLFKNQLGRTECLEEAQAYLRYLKVGDIRAEWLTPEAIRQVGEFSAESGFFLNNLRDKSDDFMPFCSPFYWAAFVCIGDDRRMRSESGVA